MNREILFRGRSFSDGSWVYGDLEYERNKGLLGKVRIHTYKEDGSYDRQYLVESDTVGQFTGMTDKNGKRVFEGDIVRYWREDSRKINPDCDPFNWIYESFIKKIEIAVSYEDGMFVCEDYTPLVWCGIGNLEELRNSLGVTEEDDWGDADGNTIDESVLGIEVIGNIHDTK